MGIVKGFTDVLNPVNLAINGQFHINQRGLFTGGYAAAKVNDYVSDCWQVNMGTNVDYLEVYNDISLNLLKVKGYGKKGQYVDLYNSKAWDNIYRIRSMTRAVETTASFVLRHIAGVPIQGRAVPMQLTGNTSVYEYQPKLKNPSFDKPVGIRTNPVNVSGSSSYGQALVYLLADGAFEFAVSDFVNVVGAYVNPPTVVPVSRAEDFTRCKRFYQKRSVAFYGNSLVDISGTPRFQNAVSFETEMVSTPTVSLVADWNVSTSYVTLYNVADNAITASDGPNWSPSLNTITSSGFYLSASRNAPVTNRTSVNTTIVYEATI